MPKETDFRFMVPLASTLDKSPITQEYIREGRRKVALFQDLIDKMISDRKGAVRVWKAKDLAFSINLLVEAITQRANIQYRENKDEGRSHVSFPVKRQVVGPSEAEILNLVNRGREKRAKKNSNGNEGK